MVSPGNENSLLWLLLSRSVAIPGWESVRVYTTESHCLFNARFLH
jgi:hypothetical protein